MDNITFGSSDSIHSVHTDSSEGKVRRVPLIRKTKLIAPSVFGNTSKLFDTPAPVVSNRKITATKPIQKNRFEERATDTNYTATMQRLQVFKFISFVEWSATINRQMLLLFFLFFSTSFSIQLVKIEKNIKNCSLTKTNFSISKLQKICAKINAAGNKANVTSTYQYTPTQPSSNSRQEFINDDANEEFEPASTTSSPPLPPPQGFE